MVASSKASSMMIRSRWLTRGNLYTNETVKEGFGRRDTINWAEIDYPHNRKDKSENNSVETSMIE